MKAENPEAYKKLAEAGIMVGHTVKIGGRENRADIGIPYHSTVKFFNPEKDTPEAVHAVARKLSFDVPDPKTTKIEPGVFKDRLGNDVYVIKLHGEHADKIKQNNGKFSHMGFPATFEYTPHVSVEKKTWDGIVASKATTAHEAGIEFGPAQLKQGHKTLATYNHIAKPDVADQHKVLDQPKKLAASEKLDESLGKSNYGPAKMGLYSANDNARRKMDRTSDTVDAAGPNKTVKATTPSFRQQAAHEAKQARMKSKANPVRVYSEAEKKAFAKKTGQTVYKPPRKLAASEASVGQPLSKGVMKQLGTAAAMASAIGLASPTPNAAPAGMDNVSHKQSHYDKNHMLNAIAQVESSGGKFANHRALGGMHNGEHAYGKYGLTPIVIRETVRLHPELKNKHQKVVGLSGQDLHHYMQDNPGLEETIAQKHLARLEHHFGKNPEKIGYAWLNGITGTYKANKENEDIKNHWHVTKIRNAYGKGI